MSLTSAEREPATSVVIPYTKYIQHVMDILRKNPDNRDLSLRVQEIPLHIEKKDIESFKRSRKNNMMSLRSLTFIDFVVEEEDHLFSIGRYFHRGEKRRAIATAWVRWCFYKTAYR